MLALGVSRPTSKRPAQKEHDRHEGLNDTSLEAGTNDIPALEIQKLALEKYKARLDLIKFISGSVIAAIVIAAIPPAFQWATNTLEADRKIREMEQSRVLFHETYVKDFVEKALNQDIEIRLRLATYFAKVSDGSYKPGWLSYLDDLAKLRDSIRTKINKEEKHLHELRSEANPDVVAIEESRRTLAWMYGELGYSEPNRDVVRNPRAPDPASKEDGSSRSSGPYVAQSSESFLGQVIGTGQPTSYCQVAAGAPRTLFWRQGALVKGNSSLPAGTLIATFDDDGRYGNSSDGRSSCAIYVGQDQNGVTVYQQWLPDGVRKRIIRFGGGAPINDGNQYYVVR